jgi:hypothetical protein
MHVPMPLLKPPRQNGLTVDMRMCEHDWFYLGGHNEWWVCRKCGERQRR